MENLEKRCSFPARARVEVWGVVLSGGRAPTFGGGEVEEEEAVENDLKVDIIAVVVSTTVITLEWRERRWNEKVEVVTGEGRKSG